MKSARHQLILLGFIAQGFSWDDYGLPLLNAALWTIALLLPRNAIRLSSPAEALVLVTGSALAYAAARAFGQSSHFFIGHGITCLQALRLCRTLDSREKVFSFILACLQLSVACTVLLDIRLFVLLLAALVLVPKALFELQLESFPGTTPRFKWSLARYYPAIAAVAVLFFLAFPRAFLNTPIHARGQGQRGTLLDAVLDPARSGTAQSRRIVLQVDGRNLGYLRSFALVDYEGGLWRADQGGALSRLPPLNREQISTFEARRVRVRNTALLGRVLPTDGQVTAVQGRFFRRPLRNTHGMIECEAIWNTANNSYEYWVEPRPKIEPLTDRQIQRLIRHPPQSDRLRDWLDQQLAGIGDPLVQARHLENYFQTNFTYRLGAPELNRLSPADDFIFNQREGHCERFAATLALLLRMKQIPSRVVLGYLPSTRNWFSGWYNIRLQDAHAWTEAYFPEAGWVSLDATPRATLPPEGWKVRDLVDALDFAWYLHVVTFDSPAQKTFWIDSLKNLNDFSRSIQGPVPVTTALVVLVGIVLWRWRAGRRAKQTVRARQDPSIAAAVQFYERFLRLLASRGLVRQPQQTPRELAAQLQDDSHGPDIELITETFCKTRYGHAPLSQAQTQAVHEALERLEGERLRG